MSMDEKLLLRLPTKMKEDLEALAVKEDRPVSWLIRHAVSRMLAEEKKNGE